MMVELSKRKAIDQADETASKNANFSDNPILSGKIAKVNWSFLKLSSLCRVQCCFYYDTFLFLHNS